MTRTAAAALIASLFLVGGLAAAKDREAPKAAPVPARAQLPARADLPCFPCHSLVKFDKGPPFAHGQPAHAKVGHCHKCHQQLGHAGNVIDRGACLGCHPAPAPTPATGGRTSN